MYGTPEEVRLKETRDADYNIIISGYTPCKNLHPNSRRCLYGAESCVVVSVAFLPKLCINIYSHEGIGI